MARLFMPNGVILQIDDKLTPGFIMRAVEGDSDSFELLSGDLLIFNRDAQSDKHPRNTLAESLGNREFRGTVILCEPGELD